MTNVVKILYDITVVSVESRPFFLLYDIFNYDERIKFRNNFPGYFFYVMRDEIKWDKFRKFKDFDGIMKKPCVRCCADIPVFKFFWVYQYIPHLCYC